MAKIQIHGAKGLLTSSRRAGVGDKGYVVRAKNVLVRHDGLYEPRFGLETLGSSSSANRLIWDPKNRQILRTSTASDMLDKWDGAAWTSLDSARKYSSGAPSRDFFFLLSDDGLRRLNVANTSTDDASIPEALDLSYTLSGSGGFLASNSQIGYRYVLGLKVGDNFYLGAPSGRLVVTNITGGDRDVALELTLPAGLTTSHFYQIYRTNPSPSSTVDPGDAMYLVYEDFYTSGTTVTVTDRVPVGNGGAELYTNESQQTDQQQNNPCEIVTSSNGFGELSLYANCLWGYNYQPRSYLDLFLLSTNTDTGVNARLLDSLDTTLGSPTLTNVANFDGMANGMAISGTGIPAGTTILSFNSGAGTVTMSANATATATIADVVIGDILTIGGVQYFAHTSESVANRQFKVYSSTSPGADVRQTAESFVRVFNRSSSTVAFYAKYLSGVNQLPGYLRITARTDRASTYTAQASSHGAAWYPNLSTAQTIASKNERNFLVFSKPDEPHAWPLLNYLVIPGNATILGLTPLRTAMLVWTDRGLYRLSGDYGNFLLDILDESVILSSSTSNPGLGVVVVDNIAYAHTNKGIMGATESGAAVISEAVSTYVNNTALVSGRLSVHYGDSLVFVPTSFGTLVYHTKNGVWLPFTDVFKAGEYDHTNRLYFTQIGTDTKRARSATYAASSHYDSDSSVTVLSVAGNVVTLSASVPVVVKKGDLLIQGLNTQVISEVSGATVTVDNGAVYSAGAATIRVGFDCEVLYCPVGDWTQGATRRVWSANILFDGAPISSSSQAYDNTGYKKMVTLVTNTDLDQTERTSLNVADSTDLPFYSRHQIPADSMVCSQMVAGVQWRNTANAARFAGITLEYEVLSEERTRR